MIRLPPIAAIGLLIGSTFLCGCSDTHRGMALKTSRQRARVLLRPSDAVVEVVDASGQCLVMNDGKQIVVDNDTFESDIMPLLGAYVSGPVELETTFSLSKTSLVVDVVQGPDGDASEVSRTYWVLDIDEIHSVEKQ